MASRRTALDPEQSSGFHRPDWLNAIGEECAAVSERVGILDMPGFAKFDVSGSGAARMA